MSKIWDKNLCSLEPGFVLFCFNEELSGGSSLSGVSQLRRLTVLFPQPQGCTCSNKDSEAYGSYNNIDRNS